DVGGSGGGQGCIASAAGGPGKGQALGQVGGGESQGVARVVTGDDLKRSHKNLDRAARILNVPDFSIRMYTTRVPDVKRKTNSRSWPERLLDEAVASWFTVGR